MMKKQVIMSLFAAFAMVLNVNAQNDLQDNTYNMVLELANGTKLTIGPHEIKNISFFDGEVVVSGTRLDDLLKKLADVRTWTIGEDGFWYVDGVKTDTYSRGKDGKDGTEWTIDDEGYWCANGEQTEFKAVASESGGGSGEISEEIKYLVGDRVKQAEAMLLDKIYELQAGDGGVDQNRKDIEALKEYIKNFENQIIESMAKIGKNEQKIAENESKIIENVKKIDANYVENKEMMQNAEQKIDMLFQKIYELKDRLIVKGVFSEGEFEGW